MTLVGPGSPPSVITMTSALLLKVMLNCITYVLFRVSTDLENLEKSGKARKISKVRESQENFSVKHIFSQFEDPNLENFPWLHAPTYPVNSIGLTIEFNLSLEKLWKSQGIPSLLES